MGRTFSAIPEEKMAWIQKQEVFWVATAPLQADGHVNVSPKGLRGSLRVESPTRVWYEDLTGSGCETIAHLRENGRITILFNAFKGPPDIVRLYGTGKVYELGTPEYDACVQERLPGSRAVIVVDVHRVGTSCGWGIPFYKFQGHRRVLLDFSRGLEKKDKKFEEEEGGETDDALVSQNGNGRAATGDADADADAEEAEVKPAAPGGLKDWWRRMNAQSIDGLPSVAHAGYVVGRPMGGSIPDPDVAGFKQSGKLDLPPVSASTPNTGDGEGEKRSLTSWVGGLLGGPANANGQLLTGVCIGVFASFVLSDLVAFGRRYVAAM